MTKTLNSSSKNSWVNKINLNLERRNQHMVSMCERPGNGETIVLWHNAGPGPSWGTVEASELGNMAYFRNEHLFGEDEESARRSFSIRCEALFERQDVFDAKYWEGIWKTKLEEAVKIISSVSEDMEPEEKVEAVTESGSIHSYGWDSGEWERNAGGAP